MIFSTIGNYFTPFRGGLGFRAVYLKKKFDFPYSRFLSTLSGNYIIVLFVHSLVALMSLIWIHAAKGLYSLSLYIFLSVLFAFCLFLNLVRVKTTRLEIHSEFKLFNNLLAGLKQAVDGWNEILSRRSLVLKLFLIIFIGFVSVFLKSFIEFRYIASQTSVPSLLLYSALTNLSMFISITPAAIGIRESIFLLFQNLMNLSTADILNIAVIDRGVMFLTLLLVYLSTKVFRYDRS
jgi:uncharacterized membrane protein YbhN (UPF0104 family)